MRAFAARDGPVRLEASVHGPYIPKVAMPMSPRLVLLCAAALLLQSTALGDDSQEDAAMFEIEMPASDVVGDDAPLVIRITADDGRAAVDAASLTLTRRGAHAVAKPLTFDLPIERDSMPVVLSLDAGPLAPGEYDGTLVVRGGNSAANRAKKQSFRIYRIPTALEDPFPFGIYAVPFEGGPDSIDATLREVESFGINFRGHWCALGTTPPRSLMVKLLAKNGH